jgi:aminobenzoyl-glutamate transport protein
MKSFAARTQKISSLFPSTGVLMNTDSVPTKGRIARALDWLERVGNKLPDPVLLFVFGLLGVWVLSALLAQVQFSEIDPSSITKDNPNGSPLRVNNLLTGTALASFLSNIVKMFTGFHALGVVLVAMLGVGVADRAGMVNAVIKKLLAVTAKSLLTPMLLFVALISHTAADAGYVLVIPLGAAVFAAAGRHPLAGLAAAFAGVSGGFSANFLVSGLDPMLAGLTQVGVNMVDKTHTVNPLCNLFFTMSSGLLIIGLGWFLTDKVIEPRLKHMPIDGEFNGDLSKGQMTKAESRGLVMALGAMLLGVLVLFVWAWPADSALRAPNGSLTSVSPPAPLMGAIVPLIFLLFLIPGVVFGYFAGTFKGHRDVIKAMSSTMSDMGYYLVMAFFVALFIDAFGKSNIGVLVALKGANALRDTGASAPVTIVGVIFLTATVNLLIGSASAKWSLLAPVFVPMLMMLGISPELTQAAYRVGDSSTNIITPMMPYFPLIVTFAQRHCKSAGLGTIISLMLPYSALFLLGWTVFLLLYWQLGIPLGIQAGFEWPPK